MHDVRHPFSFKNNEQFIFHDSRGFEAGGKEEFDIVKAFIEEKVKSKDVMNQIHAIWCVSSSSFNLDAALLATTFMINPRHLPAARRVQCLVV